MGQARRRGSRQKGASSHGFGMFVAGLVVGAVGASFFVGLRSDDPESIGRGIEHLIANSRNQPSSQEAAPPAVGEQKRTTEFEFFMMLPEVEQFVPDTSPVDNVEPEPEPAAVEVAGASTAPVMAPVTVDERADTGERFEIQAGAFARMADADRLKARLALEGLQSRIQKVSIEGRGDFFRVRLGPFEKSEQLGDVDSRLAALGIKSLRLKISGG
jgi:cell division protein FtsN